MNVVMLCESAEVSGGAERVAISEALELRRRGFRVGYIAAGEICDSRLTEAGVEVLLIQARSFFEALGGQEKLKLMFANPAVDQPIREFLSKFSTDETIFHAHTYRLKLSGKAVHVAQSMGFKTIIHCHDYSPVCPTSLYYNHRTQSPCTLQPLSVACWRCECQGQSAKYKLPKMTSAWTNHSRFGLYQNASLFVHVSKQEEAIIRRWLPYGKHVLISLEKTHRVQSETNKSFGYIGRLTPEKNPRQFLSSCIEAGQAAVIIGEGPLRSELEKEFSQAVFTGWLKDEELEKTIQKLRALVVPSRWNETYGLSVVDCMSRGVPCIVSTRVGAKDWIKDGQNGQIFDADSSVSLTEAIIRYVDDNLVLQHSEAAYEDIWLNPPTIERHVDELLTQFRELIGSAS
jgi:glycosyltransferase involved in cell wall biosynthesis